MIPLMCREEESSSWRNGNHEGLTGPAPNRIKAGCDADPLNPPKVVDGTDT